MVWVSINFLWKKQKNAFESYDFESAIETMNELEADLTKRKGE